MVYLGKRQQTFDDGGNVYSDGSGSGWYSDTGEAIKWAIVAAIFFAIMLYFIGGYVHAKRRARKGQQPLAYHRPSAEPIRNERISASTSWYDPSPSELTDNADDLAYNPNDMPPPPMYEPPSGASKANPDQHFAPPSGPPPSHQATNERPSTPTVLQRRESSSGQYNNVPLHDEESQLPPRPKLSGRSWNPLKRFK
ncbi:MAG: hypothetical protein Q9218_006267 [Villophora microphyllina]